MKSHLFTLELLKDCGHNIKNVHKSQLLNGSKYKYLRVKTVWLIARKQNSICMVELCTPVHSSTNSETHLAICHPCVLQKNLEHAAFILSWTLELIQFSVWNILWLFYLTAEENAYYGLYSKLPNVNHFKL